MFWDRFFEKTTEKPLLPQWVLKSVFFAFASVSILLAVFQTAGKTPVYVNRTLSAPCGVYLIQPFGDIGYGDYVIAYLPETVGRLRKGTLLLKKVQGLPGDVYTKDGNGVTVKNKFFPTKATDKLPQLKEGTYTVPDGKVLLINDAKNSFDGRYLGPVERTTVLQKVVLVLDFAPLKRFERGVYDTIGSLFPSLKKASGV